MSLAKLELYISRWVETLPPEHPVKAGLLSAVKELMGADMKPEDFEARGLPRIRGLDFVKNAVLLSNSGNRTNIEINPNITTQIRTEINTGVSRRETGMTAGSAEASAQDEGADGLAAQGFDDRGTGTEDFDAQKDSAGTALADPDPGTIRVRVEVDDAWYYKMLSNLSGTEISGEYQLIAMVRELSAQKEEYEKTREAMEAVRATGYGVIMPGQQEISLEEPVVTRQGGKFGVKLKATSPSIHLIRADIDTEIAPIVGSEQQAEDLIVFLKESAKTGEGIWDTNIFGKTIRQMTEEGIQRRLSCITDESREKLQLVMRRILNESTGGIICIII